MTDDAIETRFCPFCGQLLERGHASRFVTCPSHGKLVVNAAVVGGSR